MARQIDTHALDFIRTCRLSKLTTEARRGSLYGTGVQGLYRRGLLIYSTKGESGEA
jgi:hypothetical protein